MSPPSINFLHLTVSEIQAGQTFSRSLPATRPTALKGCGVKMGISFTFHVNLVRVELPKLNVAIHGSNFKVSTIINTKYKDNLKFELQRIATTRTKFDAPSWTFFNRNIKV